MRTIRLHRPRFGVDNMFAAIVAWYLLGGLTLLGILYIVEWLLQ
jgi:hypothetical protein